MPDDFPRVYPLVLGVLSFSTKDIILWYNQGESLRDCHKLKVALAYASGRISTGYKDYQRFG
jgi:hypothetical protein